MTDMIKLSDRFSENETYHEANARHILKQSQDSEKEKALRTTRWQEGGVIIRVFLDQLKDHIHRQADMGLALPKSYPIPKKLIWAIFPWLNPFWFKGERISSYAHPHYDIWLWFQRYFLDQGIIATVGRNNQFIHFTLSEY